MTFGHHLLAYDAMLARDLERFADTRHRVNRLPLGSAWNAHRAQAFDNYRQIGKRRGDMPRHLVCLTFDFDALSLWAGQWLARHAILSPWIVSRTPVTEYGLPSTRPARYQRLSAATSQS